MGLVRWVRWWQHAVLVLVALWSIRSAEAQIAGPLSDPRAVIAVSADQAVRWRQGEYDIWHLRGNCQLQQARTLARGQEAILWVDRTQLPGAQMDKVICYLEDRSPYRGVQVDYAFDGQPRPFTGLPADLAVDQPWIGRFHSTLGIQFDVPQVADQPAVKPDIFQRAMAAVMSDSRYPIARTQFTAAPSVLESLPRQPSGGRQIEVMPRSGSVRIQVRTFEDPSRNENITIFDSGIKVVIKGVQDPRLGDLGTIVIETDRAVIWHSLLEDLSGQSFQQDDAPLEVYLEGNIVFSQGDRVIYAERMYYNVRDRYGTVLNAEILTPVPEYEGLLRLKADVLQQVNEQNFIAYGAALTSSRLGVPRYWLQSENVTLQDIQTPQVDPFTGQVIIDPASGEPQVDHELLTTSRNNFAYVGGLPIFYWPVLATDLTKPFYYIDRLSVRNDSIFGTQLLTDWDMYQLLGIRNPPQGTDWTVTLDLLSERGIGVGTDFDYVRGSIFGLAGPAQGMFDFWGINDQGLDNLGQNRRGILPETDNRGRVLLRHRQQLDLGFQITGEIGLVSDRTFLEQYFEHEWDQQKDHTTGLELKHLRDDMSLGLVADVRLNDFFTQTEWLPRLDHFVLGHSLLWDRGTWHAHSHAGYARLRVADTPTNPVLAGQFANLPWETNALGVPTDRNGVRAGTRHELDLPFDAGPFRLVPYVLGDITHWQEDLGGVDVTRAYGQAGMRASLPMWRVDPSVQSALFNLNGLAHKVVFDAEYLWADANRNLARFPLYDPLDDDAQEFFRRRFVPVGPFPGGVPLAFDERFYAFRSGMQGHVTAPSMEIADDLTMGRLGIRQRWQTKRGLPGQERIVDWIVFDVEGAYFPQAGRDNFGADVGLINYDFQWHIGDRLTLLSDGYFDTFGQGLRTISLGGLISRPELGNVYVGFRSIEGPISSNILSASLSYRMSEKWIATAGAAIDFSNTGNIGQTLSFTRIGESFLVRLGLNVDVSRGNIGAVVTIEPRFLPNTRLGQVGGVQIPPAGARGLE